MGTVSGSVSLIGVVRRFVSSMLPLSGANGVKVRWTNAMALEANLRREIGIMVPSLTQAEVTRITTFLRAWLA